MVLGLALRLEGFGLLGLRVGLGLGIPSVFEKLVLYTLHTCFASNLRRSLSRALGVPLHGWHKEAWN